MTTAAPTTPLVGAPTGTTPTVDVDGLLPLALSQPDKALAMAHLALRTSDDPRIASVAHQAAGIVHRDAGRTQVALGHLRQASRLARRTGDPARIGDVQATFGVLLVAAGRSQAGLSRLQDAIRLVTGLDRARVRLRLAHALLRLERPQEALEHLGPALVATRRAGDLVWEARCLEHRGWARGLLGRYDAAEDDAQAAAARFAAAGQHFEAGWVVGNRALVALYRGDLPRTLAILEQAERHFAAGGTVPPEPEETRCRALQIAGLAPEALARATAAAQRDDVPPPMRGEFLLVAASAALQLGHDADAVQLATRAGTLFARQRRGSWAGRAQLVRTEALMAGRPATARDLSRAIALAGRLDGASGPEAPLAHLLAGRLALTLRRPGVAQRELHAAARGRHTGASLPRASGWLAAALRSGAQADTRALRHACRRGLDALDEFRATFGDTELRSLATGHGRDLSTLALVSALDTGSARDLLWWSERWRATALAATPVHPPPDPELAATLAGARQATRRLQDPAADAATVARATRERARHEAGIRRRYRQLSGSGEQSSRLDLGALVEAVGSDALVSLVDVRDTLYAVRVHRGRVTRHEVGATTIALRESEFARFALRRAAYGRPADVARMGARLQQALLGPVADRLPGRVVVVPPAALHAAPWGLLPALFPRRLVLAPSARLWLQARSAAVPPPGRPVLVTGPGLTSQAAEATAVAARYAAATVLSGAGATVAETVRALDGAGLAHLAAHGSFRADAPLFSALTLADGPLYFHDLDGMTRPPHTLVLSACDAGDTAAVGADEGLGLVTALLGLGTRAVLASVVPVNDAATIPVMTALHDGLAGGQCLSTAMAAARLSARDDPASHTAAVSFTPWGG
ncbi:MAG: CHAT domain-containing protein [Dermatophilaceae bacterium]